MSDMEIKHLKKSKLKYILRNKINEKALQYLLNKRGSKGSEIKYKNLQMSLYLSPNEYNLKHSEKEEIFAIRNKMINIFGNFQSQNFPKLCQVGCLNIENMTHIYMCGKLNECRKTVNYDNIYTNNMTNILYIYKVMKENLNKRQQIIEEKKTNIVIPSDPL